MPTKSACASAELVLASVHSGEPCPNTRVMSPVAFVEVFSSSMFAVPTPPTSQPSRVNGTHGAGVFRPPSVIMFGFGSNTESTWSVQYLNADEKPVCPFEPKYPYELETVIPFRSG